MLTKTTVNNAAFLPTRVLLAVALVGALALAGCQEAGPDYPQATLEGAVTLDGTPVDAGRVNFMPASGTPGVPTSADIEAGSYKAEVPLGNVTVTFSVTKNTGEMIIEGDRQPYPKIVSVVPHQYSDGIQLNVSGDNAAQDFALVNQ